MPANGTDSTAKKCGFTEISFFMLAIATGTACSIISKSMMELKATGKTGKEELFDKPLFQTFIMFAAMLFGLILHWVVVYFRMPFPGYHFPGKAKAIAGAIAGAILPGHGATEQDSLLPKDGKWPSFSTKNKDIDTEMYFLLAVPSLFDLIATALSMMGLVLVNVSIYQMLHGADIIFTALLKQSCLGDRLYKFQWLGIAWNVVSVVLIGATAMWASTNEEEENEKGSKPLLGVVLILVGAFIQAMQYVFEEKVLKMDNPAPPLLLVGMEGLWGTLFCLVLMYPTAYFVPGSDHGSYEDPFNTFYMVWHSSAIMWWTLASCAAIFLYNMFAILVTFELDSVWHSILDNFRPITVWGSDLFIFYFISKMHGEPWSSASWLQLVGMAILLYGTSIYDAPNAGSLRLRGQWYSFGFDFSREYRELEGREGGWEKLRRKFLRKRR